MFTRYFSQLPAEYKAVKKAVGGDPAEWIPGATHSKGGDIVVEVKARGLRKRVRLNVGAVAEDDGRLRVPVSWEATGAGFLFPRMDGEVELSPWNASDTLLCLQVDYTPPLGAVGRALDQKVLHGLAWETLGAFRDGIRSSLSGAGGGEARPRHGASLDTVLGASPAVRDIMTTRVTYISPDATLLDAAALMREKRISGLPVVEGLKVVGYISETDIMHEVTPARGRRRGMGASTSTPAGIDFDAGSRPVADAMTRKVVTVTPEESAWAAATLLERHRYRALPVVSAFDRLEGVVARADFLGLVAPDDALLQRRVRQALTGLDAAAAQRIETKVTHGQVTLSGRTRSATYKAAAVKLVGQVPGVRAVHDAITYTPIKSTA